jgi:glycosyltransferase involved in cell wall biosynthesis
VKLGLITPHYPPDLTGAAEFVAHAQARELTARGHEVRVVAGCSWEHSGRDVLRGRIDDSSVSYLPMLEEERLAAVRARSRWTRLALQELRGVAACLVHHSASLSGDLVSTLARRMPVLVQLGEDAELHELSTDIRSADHVLASSACLEVQLLELEGSLAGRVEVQGTGLCRVIPDSHEASRRAAWDGERPLSLFHFGKRTRHSGIDMLLDGLRELPAGRFELILAGGEGEPGLDDRIEGRAGETPVHFFGPYQTSQLASACDLAVFPAATERGRGIVVEEALALGLPVWCSEQADPLGRIGSRDASESTPDFLSGGGLAGSQGQATLERVESRPGRILPADSSTAWARAFEQLLEDPEQLHAERHAIPKSFETTRDVVDRLECLFESLLSEAIRKAS